MGAEPAGLGLEPAPGAKSHPGHQQIFRCPLAWAQAFLDVPTRPCQALPGCHLFFSASALQKDASSKENARVRTGRHNDGQVGRRPGLNSVCAFVFALVCVHVLEDVYVYMSV